MREQTSFYDADYQPLMDLERQLIKARNFSEPAAYLSLVDLDSYELPKLASATADPTDEPAPIIQSQHLRWTVEHASDVVIACLPPVSLQRQSGEL